MSNIEIGRTYHVNHSRKGQFKMQVTGVNGEWIEGKIVSGEAQMLARKNVEAGEEITVREGLADWTVVAEPFENPMVTRALNALASRRRVLYEIVGRIELRTGVAPGELDSAMNEIERAAVAVYIEQQRPVPMGS